MLGIRSLAKNLTNVPGRKSVVLFTAGFPLTSEAQAELTATISACNQANVAIYPLDVRGLIAARLAPEPSCFGIRARDAALVASADRLATPRAQPVRGWSSPRIRCPLRLSLPILRSVEEEVAVVAAAAEEEAVAAVAGAVLRRRRRRWGGEAAPGAGGSPVVAHPARPAVDLPVVAAEMFPGVACPE